MIIPESDDEIFYDYWFLFVISWTVIDPRDPKDLDHRHMHPRIQVNNITVCCTSSSSHSAESDNSERRWKFSKCDFTESYEWSFTITSRWRRDTETEPTIFERKETYCRKAVDYSANAWIEMKTTKHPKLSLETSSEAQTTIPVLLLLQEPKSLCKDQLQVLILMMKRVTTVMRLVNREQILEEQYSIQISDLFV